MTVQERLSAPLDAGRVKQRDSGRGGSVSYLETHDVIRTANDIFGFGQWGHDIIELRNLGSVTVHNRDGKAGVHTGYVCVVRLTVNGCIPVSGVGYGDGVEYRESATVTAHELAAKEAESDALKRALKNFGDQFGLALYDKSAGENGHLVYENRAQAPAAAAHAQSVQPSTDGAWTWPFGKHKGLTLADTPPEYLDWFMERGDKEDIKERILAHRGAPVGAFTGDDDIPFVPTVDGLGN